MLNRFFIASITYRLQIAQLLVELGVLYRAIFAKSIMSFAMTVYAVFPLPTLPYSSNTAQPLPDNHLSTKLSIYEIGCEEFFRDGFWNKSLDNAIVNRDFTATKQYD